MAQFPRDVLDAVAQQREVTLTTTGRKSGKQRTVTIWITTDGEHVFIRSGGGMRRDWPQNLEAGEETSLRVGGNSIKVKARHVTDPYEAREISTLVRKKYGFTVRASKPDQPLTPGEQASFELLPAD